MKISNNAPSKMYELLLRFYCAGYNTLFDSAISWIEPTDDRKDDAQSSLAESGIEVSEEEFMEVFNAWIMSLCDSSVILGNTIPDTVREKVRLNYSGYGITKDARLPDRICRIMGWGKNDHIADEWSRILRETFMDKNGENDKYYIDLSRVKPRFDRKHKWYQCERCSELTPYLLKGRCPSCQSGEVHQMTDKEFDALVFWRQPIEDALNGASIRVIDTEEHTAQLSHKDQRDNLWSKTEQYELRFQDFLKTGETPVDILSSTTTMEVGIDIGSLVAVGLRNIPPMRENYQQRAGRAGRRGSSLSTIVTFCEDGPHDALYFSNPVPMFRGDPRRPWIDVRSEKIVQRHLNLVVLYEYLKDNSSSIDVITAMDFLDDHLQAFKRYLDAYHFSRNDVLVPDNAVDLLHRYKDAFKSALDSLLEKRHEHPELFETDGETGASKKALLDALYEEGIIPTYSFPKNVVGTYITENDGKLKYKVERGLDIAISEYAPGRAIVVDKTTYQIGGLYYPFNENNRSTASFPARRFIQDANYLKNILLCDNCGWFGLEADGYDTCPFCGNAKLDKIRSMLRPWGFAPKNGTSIEEVQLNEQYSSIQQPLYSTLPEASDVSTIDECVNIRMAVRANQRIIMLNKGVGEKGFMVCRDCGAAMPGDDMDALKNTGRPFGSKYRRSPCKHNAINVNLGYDFVTDMLVLEFALDRKSLDVNVNGNTWLKRAGQSLAEGLRLAVCKELDIEFTELVTGFRVRRNQEGDFVDIYLYDSLSSGAGYAVSIEKSIRELLEKTYVLLDGCNCGCACHKCLKHYRNQHIHGLLDREAAKQLLDWGIKGIRAPELSIKRQKFLLDPLRMILHSFGLDLDMSGDVISVSGKKEVMVYPAMRTKPEDKGRILLSDMQLKYAKPYALKIITDSVRSI